MFLPGPVVRLAGSMNGVAKLDTSHHCDRRDGACGIRFLCVSTLKR